jgi:hypothetical protein
VRPVVALDIDGTAGNWHAQFLMFLEKYLGVSEEIWWEYNGSGELSEWLRLDKRTYQEAKLAFRSGGFKRWMEAREGLDRFVKMVEGLECDLWVTTTRPWMRLDNMDPDTREWLRRNEVPYKGLLYDENKYDRLCEAIDKERVVLVLEDQLDQCNAAKRAGLPVVMMGSNWNRYNWRGHIIAQDFERAGWILSKRVTEWREQHGSE